MRISRLEIFGFKSFLERFVVNFDHNLVGVVGPNGCGKSNIVDALCWVLGETHAKHLRGTVLDDIIFNGTQSRKPLGMTEVSITVRPNEGWTPPHFEDDEIQLLDSSLELASSGIPQLRVLPEFSETGERVNGSQAEEQRPSGRGAFTGLEGIPGLLQASEIQLTRRLYRSGESEYFINRVPCRLRDMLEVYRAIGLGARGLSIVQQGQIGEIVSKKPIARRELLEEAAGISGIRARIEAAQRSLTRTAENMARLSDIITEVEKQVALLKRQAQRATRRGQLKADLRSIEQKLFEAQAARILAQKTSLGVDFEQLTALLDAERMRLSAASSDQETHRLKLEGIDLQLEDARRLKDQLLKQLSEARAKELERERELSKLITEQAVTDRELVQVEERRTLLKSQLEQLEHTLAQAATRFVSINSRREELEGKLERLNIEREKRQTEEASAFLEQGGDFETRLATLRETVSDREEHVRESRKLLSSTEAELEAKSIEFAETATEVRTLERQLRAFSELYAEEGSGDHEGNTLLETLRVPAGYEQAVNAILGERGAFFITDSLEDTLKHPAREPSAEKNRFRFGFIDSTVTRTTQERPVMLADLESLTDKIEVAPVARNAIFSLLGHVYLVNDLANGMTRRSALLAAQAHDWLLVTLRGEVISPWGWYTNIGEGLSFSFSRVLDEKKRFLEQCSRDREELEQRTTQLRAKLAQCEEQLTHANRVERQEHEALISARQQLTLSFLEERRLHGKELDDERALQEELRRVVGEASELHGRRALETARRAEVEKEFVALGESQEQLKNRAIELAYARDAQAQSPEQAHHAKEREQVQYAIAGELRALEQRIQQLDEERSHIRSQFSAAVEVAELARRTVDELRETHANRTLAQEKLEIALQMLVDEGRRSLGAHLELPSNERVSALSGEAEELIQSLQEDSTRLRNRLEREGEVDESSIELHAQEEKRLGEMKAQYADLERAHGLLEETIRRLKSLSRTRFLATFESVSRKFEELVPRLFGGGSGRLELVNPEDPLTSGVELIVRPPGKKVKSMELLSGGEKALAATAVLMSMFLHRPSPICVLDEVDAPLDDANLDRFLGLVREISATTQFLIITHNKQSMAAVDKLIGITMQEKGVSTALSVNLEQLEERLGSFSEQAVNT